ncbi:MAG: hypothetical protein KY466_04400, partial [Gemmatimonadetes bacterium]|nr:hypothetical protein [Gemmatimonadota bacterium]
MPNRKSGAAAVAVAPAVLMAGVLYHPYIRDLTDSAAVAATIPPGPTRWAVAHLTVAVGSALLMIAFLALREYLRDAGETRWSARGLPFVLMGSTLFALLPALEFAPLVAVWIGGDVVAAQTALSRWFIPILLAGSVVFGVGALAFAAGIARSHVLAAPATRVVVAALVVMVVTRFIPRGAALYVGGAAGLV